MGAQHQATARAVDFAAWFRRQGLDQRRLCELWLKIDIEGAEYDLIPHLLETKVLCFMTRISIEWHAGKPWMGPRFRDAEPWMLAMEAHFAQNLSAACPGRSIAVEDWVGGHELRLAAVQGDDHGDSHLDWFKRWNAICGTLDLRCHILTALFSINLAIHHRGEFSC